MRPAANRAADRNSDKSRLTSHAPGTVSQICSRTTFSIARTRSVRPNQAVSCLIA